MDRLAYMGQALFVGVPWYKPADRWEQLEDQVQLALGPVRPPDGFRRGLADGLQMAAQRKTMGLVVEYPQPRRERIIIGLSAGLLAATLGAVAFVLYYHAAGARR